MFVNKVYITNQFPITSKNSASVHEEGGGGVMTAGKESGGNKKE